MPDEEVTFTLNVNAPAVPGTHLLSFRLKENDGVWRRDGAGLRDGPLNLLQL
jgi:hypothetical protein